MNVLRLVPIVPLIAVGLACEVAEAPSAAGAHRPAAVDARARTAPASPDAAPARPTSPAVERPAPGLPAGFVDAARAVPQLRVEIRYATGHNFVGRPIRGYRAGRCVLTRAAARALARAQRAALAQGLSLKVYDCYRPRRAVADFVAWAREPHGLGLKAEFFPTVPKDQLIARGFVASRSSHSRGSTVDVTLVRQGRRSPPRPHRLADCRRPAAERCPDDSLDMGSGYDCFDPVSHTASRAVPPAARARRRRLVALMRRAGFVNFPKEWWHYTLAGEPYPQRSFDFAIH